MRTGFLVTVAALALTLPAVAITSAQDGVVTNEFGTPCASQPATPGASPEASPMAMASPMASPQASPVASPEAAAMASPAIQQEGTIMGGCATEEDLEDSQ
jgi:hypothetical protein